MTVREERDRMTRVEKCVLSVLRPHDIRTPDELYSAIASEEDVERADVTAAIWRLAGVNKLQITDDLRIKLVS